MNEFATIKCCLSDQREKRFSESVVTQAARTRRSFTASAKWVRSAVLVIRGGRGQEQILTLLSLFALFCNVSTNILKFDQVGTHVTFEFENPLPVRFFLAPTSAAQV